MKTNTRGGNGPDWQTLFGMDEEELLLKLGAARFTVSLTMTPKDRASICARVEEWLNQNRAKICSSPRIRQEVQSGDNYIIAAAIADVIGGAGAATAAVLIVRKGLENFCRDLWAKDCAGD